MGMSSEFVMPVMVPAPFNFSVAAVVFTKWTGVSNNMDGWEVVCAQMNLQICAFKPSHGRAAGSHGQGGAAGHDTRGRGFGALCAACSQACGRVGRICGHSDTFVGTYRYSHTVRDVEGGRGAEERCGCADGQAGCEDGHTGCADGEAGGADDPTASAPTDF